MLFNKGSIEGTNSLKKTVLISVCVCFVFVCSLICNIDLRNLHTSLIAFSTPMRNNVTKTMSKKATVEEQLSSKTNHPAKRAQLHLPALHLSCSTSLLFISPAPPPCSSSLLLHLPALHLSCSTSLLFISPAPPPCSSSLLLHLPALHLSCSTSLLFISPAPPPCSSSLLLHLPALHLSCSTSLLFISPAPPPCSSSLLLHLPALHLSCSTSLLFISPAPPPCSSSLLGSTLTLSCVLCLRAGVRAA